MAQSKERSLTMRKKIRTIRAAGIATLCLVATIVPGCATSRVNLVDSGTVSIEKVSSEKTCISKVYVFQEGNDLIVSGNVKRRVSPGPGGGHVDVTILGPDGVSIKELETPYFPRIIPLKGARESKFSVKIPILLPEGSKVQVEHHHS
jgi:hypothetical protein